MHFDRALRHIQYLESDQRSNPLHINFITPIESAVLAAYRIRHQNFPDPQFGDDCQTYVQYSGLLRALRGELPASAQCEGLQGRTYSKLTKLYLAEHIENCNAVIGELLRYWLVPQYGRTIPNEIDYAVGELHDNVISHSGGAGFSTAQVYNRNDHHQLSIAVVDSGNGLLREVHRKVPEITSHSDAIRWCLIKGNTTARPEPEFGQRRPGDYEGMDNPYGDQVEIRRREVHHKGDGLWHLSELVQAVHGNFWIWSGNAHYLLQSDGQGGYQGIIRNTDFYWNGVAIEVEFNLKQNQLLPDALRGDVFDDLAGRFGI